MGTFFKIVREGITKRLAGEVFECLTAPSASLTSVGLSPLGSTKVARHPTKWNNPEMKKITNPICRNPILLRVFFNIYAYTTYTLTLQPQKGQQEGKAMPKPGDMGKSGSGHSRSTSLSFVLFLFWQFKSIYHLTAERAHREWAVGFLATCVQKCICSSLYWDVLQQCKMRLCQHFQPQTPVFWGLQPGCQ